MRTGASPDLTLPRWNVETDLDLGPALTDLGFDIPGGDFSGIAPGLLIDEAIHAANITVDEQGTEAAAATAIGFLEAAPAIDIAVQVDRPFLFVLRHDATGTPPLRGSDHRPGFDPVAGTGATIGSPLVPTESAPLASGRRRWPVAVLRLAPSTQVDNSPTGR